MSDIAARLRACRSRSGLTYRELARESGRTEMSAGHVSDCHSGRRTPGLEQLTQFARVYRTTVKWLRDGDPAVHIWPSFRESPEYQTVTSPLHSPGLRVGAVLRWLQQQYAGHMQVEDVAGYMGVSRSVLSAFVTGHKEASKALMGHLTELTGVPATWLEMGDLYLLAELPQTRDIDLHFLMQWLTLGRKAYALRVPAESVDLFLQSVSMTREGGR